MIAERVHRRVKENVRKMLGVVTLTFLISWLALYILVTRVKFTTDMSDSELNLIVITMLFAQWLASWNKSNTVCIPKHEISKRVALTLTITDSFFHLNEMICMEMGGYGVNVSTRNFSSTYRRSSYKLTYEQLS